MAIRKIQAPGVELNEIDRSNYESVADNSIVGTTSLLMGFSDKGTDYDVKYINSMNTFRNVYGIPKTEAERYFYNGAAEVLDRGGRLYCAKLPYDNNSLDRFPFTTYSVGTTAVPLSTQYEAMTSISATTKEGCISVNLYDFLLKPNMQFGDIIRILVDIGVIQETEDMQELIAEKLQEAEDNVYIVDELNAGTTVNFCKYYTESGIGLSTVFDMMDFIVEKANVNYYDMDAFDNVFREKSLSSLSGQYRNDSTYMVNELLESVEQFNEKYLSAESDKRFHSNMYSIRDSIARFGTFDEILENFGNSRKLSYFRNYFYSLSSELIEKGKRGGKEQEIFEDLSSVFANYDRKRDVLFTKYTDLKNFDKNITSYIELSSNDQSKGNSGLMEMDELDKLITRSQSVLSNTITIVNVKKNRYEKDSYNGTDNMYVGTAVAITTAANALVYQNAIEVSKQEISDYVSIGSIQNTYSTHAGTMLSGLTNEESVIRKNKTKGFTQNIGLEPSVTENEQTVSKQAESLFPNIEYNQNGVKFNRLKDIGVVVFSMYVNDSDDRISFLPVESFVGSLNKDEQYVAENQTIFIDNAVNNNSNYIRLFSNVQFQNDQTKPMMDTDKAKIFLIHGQSATSLGLYDQDCIKTISVEKSVNYGIEKIFDALKDSNRYRIDMIVDGGVSNIAQFISQVYPKDRKGTYGIDQETSYMFQINSSNSTKQWLNVLNKYDTFCKYTRKDCMFIADGLRTLCLVGNEKRVRNTNPDNTIENTVLKDIKYMSGLVNSSYGAGYCDWFKTVDRYSGNYFWCPPSIKAAGIYTYTDAYSSFWMAPAGMNRGRLPTDVVDCAFSPTIDQAGVIYNNNWNYSVNYPIDGIVMEGQRTFQKNKTALDRVNVRRLCLGIEKVIKHISKFFNYEQNTEWLRQRFKDSISNYLEEVRTGDGISEYVVICDSRNNTIQTIENNELHLTVGIKPVKTVEFIICQFVCTNQSANVIEVAESEM